MTTNNKRRDIFAEIDAERVRQDAKWGEQNHPDVDPVLTGRVGGCTVTRMCEEVGCPTPTRARANLDREAKVGRATWSLIAMEEFAEVIEAATIAAQGDDGTRPSEETRKELVQLAAVLVSWIEAHDRRAAREVSP